MSKVRVHGETAFSQKVDAAAAGAVITIMKPSNYTAHSGGKPYRFSAFR